MEEWKKVNWKNQKSNLIILFLWVHADRWLFNVASLRNSKSRISKHVFACVAHVFFRLRAANFRLRFAEFANLENSVKHFQNATYFFYRIYVLKAYKKKCAGVQKKMCFFFKPKRLTFIYFCSKIVVLRKKIDSKVKKFRWLDSPSNGFDGWICGADSNNPWGRFEGQLD